MTAGAFPCSDCHEPDLPVRTARHTLTTAHQEIVMNHGGERLWCFDCHDVKDRDQLRTASGGLLPYGDAPLLCGQCHGHQLRDWEAGAHGLRTGSFERTATALRCAGCHNAHAPHFQPLKPEPAPRRPQRTQ
jgi:formate-dependent nitrite reductase cytochrome c552 subunit